MAGRAWTVDRRLLLILGMVAWVILLAFGTAHAEPDPGRCTFQVDEEVLRVVGDGAANVIHITDGDDGVRVTCDGAVDTFADLVEIVVEAGEGDDEVVVDNSDLGLTMTITILGQGGNDSIIAAEPGKLSGTTAQSVGPKLIDGGPGEDAFTLVASPRGDRVEMAPGATDGTFELKVTDIETEALVADISGVAVEAVTVKAGDGNDEARFVDSVCLSEIRCIMLGEGGEDELELEFSFSPAFGDIGDPFEFDGGSGEDTFTLVASPRGERFEMAPGPGEGAFVAHVTDIETELRVTDISGAAAEEVTVKLGDGDDEAVLDNSGLGFAMTINILGQGGSDEFAVQGKLSGPQTVSGESSGGLDLDGGPGEDTLMLVGSGDSEKMEFGGVPDQPVPDPHIQVTNLATGRVTVDLFVQQTETIQVEAGGGDDQLEVAWDPALMSGLETLKAVLGRGDDRLDVNLLIVTEAPDGVQPVALEVEGEGGDDEIAVTHNAGSWIDLAITADLGSGDDRFVGLLKPPPADALPGPEGVRDVSFEVVAGDGDDAVFVRNQTSELFDLGANAVLGDGEDLLEARGEMNLLAEPGRGFDTARVTRNLLRFVSLFELVELLY